MPQPGSGEVRDLADLALRQAAGSRQPGLAGILTTAPVAVLLVDRGRRTVTFANTVAHHLTPQMPQLPVRVEDWSQRVGLRHLDGRYLAVEEAPLVRLALGEHVPWEPVTVEVDGRHRNLWITAFPLTSPPSPGANGLVALFDIGPAQRGENLRGLRDRAVVAAQHSFTISDPGRPDNPLVSVNPAFEAMTGYTAEEVLGRNCRFLQGEGTDPQAVEQIRVGLAEERPVSVTLLNYRKDGTAFWNEVTISPVTDGHGRTTHFVGVQSDVTARVLAERSREWHYRREQEARAEAEAAQGRLAYLVEASAALDAGLDVDTLVGRLTDQMVPRLGDGCVLWLQPDDAASAVLHLTHRDPDRQETLGRQAARQALTELLEHPDHRDHGAPLMLAGDPGRAGAVMRCLDVDHALLLPLQVRDRRLGTLAVLRERRPRPPQAEIVLATELARRGAAALDNARRYRERDHIAMVLQRSLLPPTTPHLPGAQLATRYVPAGTGTEVGGDFYDVFDTGDGWGLVIGDVCGKGAHAAAVTGLARYTVRAAAMQAGRPAEVLALLNAALLGEGVERFVTAAYADYVPTTAGARLLLALGGHPQPLLVRDGRVEDLGAAGTLLGVIEDVDLEETTVDLHPGDAVMLLTDGVLEAPGPGGRLDDRALRERLARRAQAPGADAEALADEVIAAALGHAGGRAPDDLAVIVLRVLARP